MKYTVSNTINKPLNDVVEKFSDPNAMMKWMEGLKKVELLSGEGMQQGTVYNLTFVHKGKEMQMKETILESNLPNSVKFAYESEMGGNKVEIRFEPDGENAVKQINTTEFQVSGFKKIMFSLMKGMFKKQSLKYLDGFKAYCEN